MNKRIVIAAGVVVAAAATVLPQAIGQAEEPARRVIEVGDSEQLAAAMSEAKAGDRIELADGEYEIDGMSGRQGTEAEPITVVAANPGEAVISEGQLEVEDSSYVTFEGLKWTNGDSLKLTGSNNVRLTRNVFRLTEEESLKWVIIQGANSHHNRIDHNDFGDKNQLGNFITIDGTETKQSQYDRIDHNHFHDIGPRADNEMEAIRVGQSAISESDGHTVIEDNLFENCDGDPEIVSVKSNENIVRYNTFRGSQGALVQRHGDRGQFYGNFFLGEGKEGTGGIRLYGKDHRIFNNYFEGLTGTGYDAALQIDGGDVDTDGSLDSHFRVYRATVVHNTFVGNVSNIEVGANYEHAPADSIVADNVITGDQGKLVNELKRPENHSYAGNIAWPTGSATVGVDVSEAEIAEVDPLLAKDGSLYRVGDGSPAVDAGTGEYDFVGDDMDGQARETPDIGADERSTADVTRHPLTPADVGPEAPAQGETMGAKSSRQGQVHVLPGHLIGSEYEPDEFYLRQGDGDWELTFTPGWQGEGFAEEVRGTLPNLRSANAVFDDESGRITDHDPDFTARSNTEEFIANLDEYRSHGFLATDINLQGGNPGYSGAQNPAFTEDGSLRQEWMDRLGTVIEAHAERGMVVVLGYFYFGQDDVLADDAAIRQATVNVTDWLIDNDYRNVVIEIANEHNDDDYPALIRSDAGMAELIGLAQSRFDDAGFRLAVSASRWGDGSWPSGETAEAADLALIHCNGRNARECADAAAGHQDDYDYPIVLNETNNTQGTYDDDTLAADEESLDAMVPTGASWGYMLNQWNQYATCVYDEGCGSSGFDWALGPQPGPNGDGAPLLRNYAHGVFDHLESVVFT